MSPVLTTVVRTAVVGSLFLAVMTLVSATVSANQLGQVLEETGQPVGQLQSRPLEPPPPDADEVAGLLAQVERDGPDPRVGVATVLTSLEVRPPRTLVAHAIGEEITAYTVPSDRAVPAAVLDNPTEHGSPLVFRAAGEPVDGWVEVFLPVRPNGSTGWIKTSEVTLTRNPYEIEVDVAGHRLTIRRDGEPVLTTTVAIGTGDTPTPIGDFYLIALVRPSDPTGVYGPFAYGLSGFSETLSSFNGGQGVIGIHGTNQPELLGTNVSHGCVRVDNDVIREMTTFLPLGTPVSIS